MRYRRWLVLAALFATLTVGTAGWTATFWVPADWGAVWGAAGQWIGAVGTIAAVLTALHISRREAAATAERALVEAREREMRDIAAAERAKAEDEERERRNIAAAEQRAIEEASLVLAEVESPAADDYGNQPQWTVAIKNFGAKPVLLPRLETFLHPDGGAATWDFDDPHGVCQKYVAPTTLAAGGRDVLPARVEYDPALNSEISHGWGGPVPIFSYTDLAGRRWRRTGMSLPVKVGGTDIPELSGPDWYRASHPNATSDAVRVVTN